MKVRTHGVQHNTRMELKRRTALMAHVTGCFTCSERLRGLFHQKNSSSTAKNGLLAISVDVLFSDVK